MIVTLEEMKLRVGETTSDYDDFLTAQINLYTSVINDYCERIFNLTNYVQTIYYDDYKKYSHEKDRVYLYQFPLKEISSIKKISGISPNENESEWNLSYVRQNKRSSFIEFVRGYGSHSWFDLFCKNSKVEIHYSAGYEQDEIPLPVKEVCFSLVEERYNKKKAGIDLNLGSDIQQISIPGTMSISYDYSLQSNERSSKFGMLIGNYSNVLDRYRSERACIGDVREVYLDEEP